MPAQGKHWTVDWTVNIAWIAALVFQTMAMLVGAAWYSAKVDARIAALEANDIRFSAERDVRRKGVDDKFDNLYRDRDRLVRVETILEAVGRSLGRIEQKLDGPRN